MNRVRGAIFALSLFPAAAFAGGSTINTSVPAPNSPLQSAPIRNNFIAAATDINNLMSMFAGSSAPSSPVTFQQWANPAVNPAPISLYDGTQFVQIGALDRVAHTFTPVMSSGSLLGTPPINANTTGGVSTISLSADSNFTVTANALALNSIGAANMLANCTSGSAEPTGCGWSAFADLAIGNTNGMLPYRTGGVWGNISTGTSGGTIPLNNTANVFSVLQATNLNGSALASPQTGAVLQLQQANATAGRIEVDTYAGATHLTGVRADGTAASPTTLVANDEILSLNAWGYDAATRSGPAAALRLFAGGTWSNTSHPTYIDFDVTPTSSTTLTSAGHVENDGGLTWPSTVTGGSKGAGTINLSGGLYIAGGQVTPAAAGASGTLLQGVASAAPTFTATPTLGVAGSVVGSLSFANATSGTEKIQPATGALGSGVASLVAGTYNLVGDSLTQTETNKTLTSPVLNTPVIGSATPTAAGALGFGTFPNYGDGTTNHVLADINSAQTFTNKTLTNPTINAAALSGTITGTPTLSGNLTFSGVPILSGLSSGTCSSGIGIDASNNVIKDACPGVATGIQVGVTNITSGTTLNLLYNNAGVLGNLALGSILTTTSATSDLTISGTTSLTITQNFDSAVVASNGSLSTTIAVNTMMGWGSAGGGACHITPKYSSRIWTQISGTMSEISGGGLGLVAHWGTGTGPNNGAGTVGTAFGSTANVNGSGTTGVTAPFTIGGVISVGSIGTAIWIDGFVNSATGASLSGLSCSMHEIL